MAHYAFLDENNVVTEVITGRNENEIVDGISDWEEYYGAKRGQKCLRTSYNTKWNQHEFGGTPFRGNYAAVGMVYNEEHDIFVIPVIFDSWTLDVAEARYKAPVPEPDEYWNYRWDEDTLNWVEIQGE
jgi:hypothetical protein